MTRQQRAKQFQPFDAMKGLTQALKDREERRERVEKLELSEDSIKAVEKVLFRVEKGMNISIQCYRAFHYIVITGVVEKIDKVKNFLMLRENKIFFDDICEIRILEY